MKGYKNNESKKHVQPFSRVEIIFVLIIILLLNTLAFMAYENHQQNSTRPTMNMTPGGS